MPEAADMARTEPAPAAYPLAIAIRAACPGDQAFIFSNWIRSLADQPPFRDHIEPPRDDDRREEPRRRGLDRNWYAAAQHALIDRLLKRPGVQVLVACEPEYPDHLIGFLCCEPRPRRLVHWLYVKKGVKGEDRGPGFRCAGVATRLMISVWGETGHESITGSIRTATGTALAGKWLGRWPITFRSHFLCEEQP